MTPHKSEQTGVLNEEDENVNTESVASDMKAAPRKLQLVWRYVIGFIYLHIAAVYGLYLAFTSAKLQTNLFALLYMELALIGLTAGAHRLWSHRTYKAKWPMKLFLTMCNSIAFQGSIFHWARDHRMHHKFSETDADPYNPSRGFFFAHIGWICCRKHPEVSIKGKQMDISDLYSDPIVRFQKKHYFTLSAIFSIILPTFIPWYFWNETIRNVWFVPIILRYCLSLNFIFLVNSLAHSQWFGYKPYDKFIAPVESKIASLLNLGECFHNYHHAFPWDYKSAELKTGIFNITTIFIDFCSMLGIAYDLKTASPEMVKKRVMRTGDGSHQLWGWGDVDQPQDERDEAIILGKMTD